MEFAGPRAPHPHRLRHVLTGLVLLAHCSWIAAHWVDIGHMPASDRWMLPSLVAISLILIYLPVEWASRTPQTGSFVTGLCFLLQLLASAFARPEAAVSTRLGDPAFALHIAMSTLALAALLLSGFYGWLYLLLMRQMRRHEFGVIFSKLPDLDSLSRLNRGAATAGFVLLTIGMNLALAWAHADEGTKVDYLDPKILVVMITWIFFGLIAASRWIRLLSGRRAAILALSGLTLVFLTLVVASMPIGSMPLFK
jgi:ABC-type uncharacterized transport system permease subunit